jgi:hypothetical protein
VSDVKSRSQFGTAKQLVEPGCIPATGPPQIDPSLQVRLLQILADKVVESLRPASSERSRTIHNNITM